MNMKRIGPGVLVVAAMASLAGASAAAEDSGLDGALHWIARIDTGDYAGSWSDAGDLFKGQLTPDQWGAAVEPIRGPLGKVIARKLKGETRATTLPGAPPGDYDVVQFDTDFAGKHDATETVILAHEATGWKVDGYFIR